VGVPIDGMATLKAGLVWAVMWNLNKGMQGYNII